jgi:hypothetical protein
VRGQTSILDDVPPCAWCGDPIPALSATGRQKRPSSFCSKRCRQASWRFGHAGTDAPAGHDARPLRLAYADPPYPGMSARHYGDHPEFDGEVDHQELVARLESDYDGWALSTSPRSVVYVADVLAARGLEWWRDYRVGIWTKPAPPSVSRRAKSAWEPVIFRGGRPRPDDAPHLVDWVHAAQPRDWPARGVGRQTGRVTGIKPSAFSVWVSRSLGADPAAGDTLDDLFPGSGAVGEAWRRYVAASGGGEDGAELHGADGDHGQPREDGGDEGGDLGAAHAQMVDTSRGDLERVA